jgi:hypothetical protein
VPTRFDTQLLGAFRNDLERLGIIESSAITGFISIVPGATLLTEAACFEQSEVRLIVSGIGRVLLWVRAVHFHADVDASHIEHGEDAHRHTPLFER